MRSSARFDLKADRKTSRLLVRAAHAEPAVSSSNVADAAAAELDALRSWLGLDGIAIGRRGNLADGAAPSRFVARTA